MPTITETRLKAPFTYFGGKSKPAPLIWQLLGNPNHYIEPFAGSAAVLLSRPKPFSGVETINDLDGNITNVWRAIKNNPVETATWTYQLQSEDTVIARENYLTVNADRLTKRLRADPEYYDAKMAGYWIYSQNLWIGGGMCDPKCTHPVKHKLIQIENSGNGIFAKNALPIEKWLTTLANRLEKTRVVNGKWQRIVTPGILRSMSNTGIFLDPPYSPNERKKNVYKHDDIGVSEETRQWCIENGGNPNLRIVLAGYAGEGHEALESVGWVSYKWKANGGRAVTEKSLANRFRETLWASPHCLHPQNMLF